MSSQGPARFGIVGGGWRTEFFSYGGRCLLGWVEPDRRLEEL